jgi:hypothetical protein
VKAFFFVLPTSYISFASNFQHQQSQKDRRSAMLIQSPGVAPDSIAHIDGDLALSRLTVLLSQQERLLAHPLSDADLYLYDLRAEEIRDLIAQLESNRLEAEANSSRWMESPTTGRFAVSGLAASEVRGTKPYGKDLSRCLAPVATSTWLVRVLFTRMRYLLLLPFFRHGSSRDPASRGRSQPQSRLSP